MCLARQPDFAVSQPDLKRPTEFSIASQKGKILKPEFHS